MNFVAGTGSEVTTAITVHGVPGTIPLTYQYDFSLRALTYWFSYPQLPV